MVKSPKLRKQLGRKTQPHDVSVVNIMRFLKKGPANKTQIGLSKGINGIPNPAMSNILDQMCEDEWASAEQSKYAKNVIIYSLLDKGMKLVNDLEKIDNKELLKLDFFKSLNVEV